MRTKSAFAKYSRVQSARGLTGAQAAEMLLSRAGIRDVAVEPTRGMLTDHYNPVTKKLALSEAVYGSSSLAAVGVAAHEAGHAIQHATHYAPLWWRSALVPTANIGSSLGYMGMMFGLMMASTNLVVIGALLFSAVVLFQLVTLPVEFDASARAKKVLVEQGIVSPVERDGVDRVLNAAALTYVAAAVSSLLTLLYFLFRAGLVGGRGASCFGPRCPWCFVPGAPAVSPPWGVSRVGARHGGRARASLLFPSGPSPRASHVHEERLHPGPVEGHRRRARARGALHHHLGCQRPRRDHERGHGRRCGDYRCRGGQHERTREVAR
jgi:hypothetical protein